MRVAGGYSPEPSPLGHFKTQPARVLSSTPGAFLFKTAADQKCSFIALNCRRSQGIFRSAPPAQNPSQVGPKFRREGFLKNRLQKVRRRRSKFKFFHVLARATRIIRRRQSAFFSVQYVKRARPNSGALSSARSIGDELFGCAYPLSIFHSAG